MCRKLLKSGFDDGGLDIRGLDIGELDIGGLGSGGLDIDELGNSGLSDFEFDGLGGLESMATGSHGYLQQLVTVMHSILL